MIKLQNILLPKKEICTETELYFHDMEDRVLFDGYFNLFYIEKRKKYTAIQELYLKITSVGYRKLNVFHDRKQLLSILLKPEKEQEYMLRIPYDSLYNGVLSFELIKEPNVVGKKVSGAYYADLGEILQQPVNLGIDICTYKREAYVERNLTQLLKQVLENIEEEVSRHLRVYVIDNGETLQRHKGVQQIKEKAAGRINIYANKNAGGAGGFTRGMLEILKDKENYNLTHILLMDDDAVIDPETVIRIYGFLSSLKESWKDITVGGEMFREDFPYALFCAGESWKDGVIHDTELNLDLRIYANAVSTRFTGTAREHELYSGWWCCCYSLNTVREDNLPLPLFLHYDDIEFGLRNCDHGIVLLNGVGVWHKCPEMQFPGANTYYDIRNDLINIALHADQGGKQIAARITLIKVLSLLFKYQYKEIHLVYRGLLDFLRGPEWLYRQDPICLNGEVRKNVTEMQPISQIPNQLTSEEWNIVSEQIKKKKIEYKPGETRKKKEKRTCLFKITHIISANGWLLPPDHTTIQVLFANSSPFEAYRKRKAILYEFGSEKAAVVWRNYRMLKRAVLEYIKIRIAISGCFDQAAQRWKTDGKSISDKDAWERYLLL